MIMGVVSMGAKLGGDACGYHGAWRMTELQCGGDQAGIKSHSMRHTLLSWLFLGNLALAGGVVLLAPARAQENRLPPGPGRAAVIAACGDCHGVVALLDKHMTYDGWYGVIGDMMTNGASVPPEDRDAIAGYLADNFGPVEAQPAAK
jgi:hypothetical protein